jgi:pSer/pThr/pTyr-binding forkhead associated (FHA) protein
MDVHLRVIHGRPQGKYLKLPRGEFVFGRGPECHIRPNSHTVSRQHCLLRVTDHEVLIRDLGSTNGTLVNGIRVVGERHLNDGDQLQLGPLVLQVELLIKEPVQAVVGPALQPPHFPEPGSEPPLPASPLTEETKERYHDTDELRKLWDS